MERINAAGVTPYRNPVSHAVRVGELVFLGGITPFSGDREIARGDFPAQMRQAMANVAAVLAAAGSDLTRLAKTTVYLRRAGDAAAMNAIYREFFPDGGYPARTTVVTELSHADFLVQIEGVAQCGPAEQAGR